MSPKPETFAQYALYLSGMPLWTEHGEAYRRQRARHRRRALRAGKSQGQGAAGSAHHGRGLCGARRRLDRAFVARTAVGVDRAGPDRPAVPARLSAGRACALPACREHAGEHAHDLHHRAGRADRLEHAVPCRAPCLSGCAVPQAAALSRVRPRASEDHRARLCQVPSANSPVVCRGARDRLRSCPHPRARQRALLSPSPKLTIPTSR